MPEHMRESRQGGRGAVFFLGRRAISFFRLEPPEELARMGHRNGKARRPAAASWSPAANKGGGMMSASPPLLPVLLDEVVAAQDGISRPGYDHHRCHFRRRRPIASTRCSKRGGRSRPMPLKDRDPDAISAGQGHGRPLTDGRLALQKPGAFFADARRACRDWRAPGRCCGDGYRRSPRCSSTKATGAFAFMHDGPRRHADEASRGREPSARFPQQSDKKESDINPEKPRKGRGEGHRQCAYLIRYGEEPPVAPVVARATWPARR